MRLVNLIAVVWLVLALGTVGYFASLEIPMVGQVRQDGLRASPTQVKHLVSTPAAP